MDFVALLTPDGLAPWAAVLLIAVAGFTSAMTAAFGIGGGLLLIAVMIPLVPISALVPVHGVVQLGSNTGRLVLQARHLRLDILTWFTLGAIGGGVAGGLLVVDLPETALKLGVGLFVLWSVWGKMPKIGAESRLLLGVGGAASTLLTMFVGATGPFVMALYTGAALTKNELVALFAGSMFVQHLLKIVVFGALGFAFAEWLPLALAMVLAGFAGTVVGTRVLSLLPEKVFRTGLKALLTLIGLHLVLSAGATLID
ncbi:sulfite exporter TauE/SafE family protein [Amorphus orientalis]|uniref:Probable membrane transporter protein n=1 Tax=Amorphus orientalis TaxID=649198 RepID=A0AAE3VL91_9HYPH|nr:sulfite exporter TauE/SafE family protein [Amorphus orientalis]MDQ0313988.1 putative membrane protein YfcA [Amorphus orientalis]